MPCLYGGIGAHRSQQKEARAARRKSRTSSSVVPASTTTSATATDATTSDSSDSEDSDAEDSADKAKKDEAMTGSKWVDVKEPAVTTTTAGIIETVGRLIA